MFIFWVSLYLIVLWASASSLRRITHQRQPVGVALFLLKERGIIWPVYQFLGLFPPSWQLPNQLIDLADVSWQLEEDSRWLNQGLFSNRPLDSQELDEVINKYQRWVRLILEMKPGYNFWKKELKLGENWPALTEERVKKLRLSAEVVGELKNLLGYKGKRRYYFLLQNNCELRPTGGFLGSLAEVEVNHGQWQISFFDVYQYDGNLPGHVRPPTPLQKAFHTGFWRLRDANWDPSFPQAAKDINWFLLQSQAKRADGFIALNYSTIKKLLKLTGPIKLPEYNLILDEDNFYWLLHQIVNQNFYPGSQYKPRLITLFGNRLLETVKHLPFDAQLKLLRIFYQDLNRGQILLYSFDPFLEQAILDLKWGGTLRIPKDKSDYFYFVESNLTANKLSCRLSRKIKDNIFLSSKEVTHNLTLTFSKLRSQKYRAYLRFILPPNVYQVKVNGQNRGYDLLQRDDPPVTEVGVWFFLNPQDKKKVLHLSYTLPLDLNSSFYQLYIQRQPGVEYLYQLKIYDLHLHLISDNKMIINQDRQVEVKLKL